MDITGKIDGCLGVGEGWHSMRTGINLESHKERDNLRGEAGTASFQKNRGVDLVLPCQSDWITGVQAGVHTGKKESRGGLGTCSSGKGRRYIFQKEQKKLP